MIERPQRRFHFRVKTLECGRNVLHFPFASISDIHWGTRACRAKRFAHMMHHVEADEWHAVGDIIDLKHLSKKEYWNIGPWHRQGIAHMLRKADQGVPVLYYRGNHETGMREIHEHKAGTPAPIWRTNRELMGVRLVYEHTRTDAKGRKNHILHGDVFDYGAFESEKLKGLMRLLVALLGSKKNAEGFIYNICNGIYESLYSVDSLLQSFPPLENASLAALAKKVFKGYINERLDIRRVIAQALDESPHDVMIYGHSHMAGFDWTPGGKLLVNDGCSTEHVNMLVQDERGVFAILTWHKDGVEVEEEPPAPGTSSIYYFKSWKDLGVDHFHKSAPALEDRYTALADRALRLVYRLAPPLERQEMRARQKSHRALIETFEAVIELGYAPRPEEYIAYHRMLADLRNEEDKLARMLAALPKPTISNA